MVLAIMGGLLVTSLLKLGFMPVHYVTWFDADTQDKGAEQDESADVIT
jgi:hypothetical protein